MMKVSARDVLVDGMKDHMYDLRMQAERGSDKEVCKVAALTLAWYYSCLIQIEPIRLRRFVQAFNLWFARSVLTNAEDPKKVTHPNFITSLELILNDTPRTHAESLDNAGS